MRFWWSLMDWVTRTDARLEEKHEGLGILGSLALAAAIIVPVALVVNFLILPALK